MAEYIDKNHFDERVRIAVGMAEGDFTEDFKDGVLFILELLKTEDSADVVERDEYDKLHQEYLKAIHRHTDCLKELHELRSKIDKAIEEIEDLNLSWVASHYEDRFYGFQQEVLEILKRNIGG